MDYEISFLPNLQGQCYRDSIWGLLCTYNDEFVPPLSNRNSSIQSSLNGLPAFQRLPNAYFDAMSKQLFLLARRLHDNQVVGFMSFIHQYQCKELHLYSPSNYVSTVIVDASSRGKGITRQFYSYLENSMGTYSMPYTTTRTWSTNASHLKILRELGFEVVTILADDRGHHIDTLYLAKRHP